MREQPYLPPRKPLVCGVDIEPSVLALVCSVALVGVLLSFALVILS